MSIIRGPIWGNSSWSPMSWFWDILSSLYHTSSDTWAYRLAVNAWLEKSQSRRDLVSLAITYQSVKNSEVIIIWKEAYCIIYQHYWCVTKIETWGVVVIPCIVGEAVVWLIRLSFLGSRRSTSVRRLTIMSGIAKEFLNVRFNSETSSELESLIWARSDLRVSEITSVSEVS